MPEKYITMALRRINIDENDCLYVPVNLVAGNIDEDTTLLTTYTGDKYKKITDRSTSDQEVVGYYYQLIDAHSIMASKEDYLEEVEKILKGISYYVSQIGEDSVIVPLDKKGNLAYINAVKKYAEKSSLKQAETHITEINNEMIMEVLSDLSKKVRNGQYSPDELIDLEEMLGDLRSVIISVQSSIKRQQSTLEKELACIEKKDHSTPNTIQSAPPGVQFSNEPINVRDLYNKITKTLINQNESARRTIAEISRLNDMDEKNMVFF